MLSKLYSWLQEHPLYNLLLLLSYYIAVVLPHNSFGAWIAKNLDEPFGRDQYNLLILILGILVLTTYLGLFWINICKKQLNQYAHNRKDKWWLGGYLFFTILLIILAFDTIIVVNIEIIHLLQYGVLAVLLFPLAQSYGVTLIGIVLFGVLDELYQYLVLNPSYAYYDFNDVILDLLGGVLGVLLLAAYRPIIDAKRKKLVRKIVHSIVGMFIALFLGGYVFGWIAIYPTEGVEEVPFQLIRQYHPHFWKKIPPNVIYHVVQPLEGVGILIGLLLIYRRLDKFEISLR